MENEQQAKTEQQGKKDDVLVFVEHDEGRRFRIQSSQLEEIGSKLRGPRQFSVFNSILLPLIVSIATIFFSSVFQYVSWLNSVRLQNATDNATRAAETYEKVAAILGKRSYATLVFIPALRDIARNQPASMLAAVKADPHPAAAAAEGSLAKFDVDVKKQRFQTYYELLRDWNDGYDQLLTAIDYDLDRPVLLQAGVSSEGVQTSFEKIGRIDCARRLTEQLDAQQLNRHSLKLQFAAVHFCLTKIHALADGIKTALLAPDAPKFDDANAGKITKSLGDLRTMANEFRCYALRRIDFYKRQREKSILSPRLLLDRMVKTKQSDALEHFTTTATRCSPTSTA
jgi:hypothetical protein